jgi:hypothetical protein
VTAVVVEVEGVVVVMSVGTSEDAVGAAVVRAMKLATRRGKVMSLILMRTQRRCARV